MLAIMRWGDVIGVVFRVGVHGAHERIRGGGGSGERKTRNCRSVTGSGDSHYSDAPVEV